MTTSQPTSQAPAPTPAKAFYQSTAFWFNAFSFVLVGLDALLGANLITGPYAAVFGALVTAGNVLIRRYSTTGPMVFGTPPDPKATAPRPEWTLDIETMRQLVALHDDYQATVAAQEGGEVNPNG